MSAKITRLDRFRSGVRCAPGGFFFPTVYRMTGFCWKTPDGIALQDCPSGDLVPDPEYPETFYTLSDEPMRIIAGASYTPITRLDPTLDNGWVIVRHHASEELMQGYLDGMLDLEEEHFNCAPCIWRTADGIFSVCRRAAKKKCEDHLLIYGARVPSTVLAGQDEYWTHVVRPDGSVVGEEATYAEDEL